MVFPYQGFITSCVIKHHLVFDVIQFNLDSDTIDRPCFITFTNTEKNFFAKLGLFEKLNDQSP